MKNLFKLISLASALITINAQASFNIKSVELKDSTIIAGKYIKALTINTNDSSVDSIETVNGDLLDATEIKLINFLKVKAGGDDSVGYKKSTSIMRAKTGGDSGD